MANLQNEALSVILLEIDSDLEKAEAARTELENEITNARFPGGYALPQEALEGYLGTAAAKLAVALDIAELRGSQAQLADRWKTFASAKDGIGATKFHPDVDSLECPALAYLEALASAIRIVRGRDTDLAERFELNKLELLLNKVPQMLRAEKVSPRSEKDSKRFSFLR